MFNQVAEKERGEHEDIIKNTSLTERLHHGLLQTYDRCGSLYLQIYILIHLLTLFSKNQIGNWDFQTRI